MRRFLRRTRVRLTAAYTTVFAAVAVLGAVGFWVALQQSEYAAVDNSLSAQANALASGLDEVAGRVTFQGTDGLPGETTDGIAIAATLVAANGTVLDRSGKALGVGDVAALVAAVRATGHLQSRDVNIAGQRERVLARPVGVGGGPAVLVVARPLKELDYTLAVTALFLAAAVAFLAVTASAAGYLLAGRALAPVRAIAGTARDLSERDLHRRLSLDLPDDELGELAGTFNGMLARLEAAFESLRTFTADAAHDLRAPLAMLLVEVDVALKHPRDAASYQESLRNVRSEAQRLSRMVDQLLVLARADAGALELQIDDVDLADLLEEAAARWQSLATRVRLVTELPASGRLRGDADLLRRLLDNLLDNAVRHSPDGGAIHLGCDRDGDWWRIVVEDAGPGVDRGLRGTLFDRFTRADPARGRDTGGAGLGLSLCAAIAMLHGGTVRLQPSRQGARFVVSLPALGPGAAVADSGVIQPGGGS